MTAANDPQPAKQTGQGAWDLLARAAAASGGEEARVSVREFVSCELDGAAYAIPVEGVREIVRPRPITPLPRVPDWILGVVALRGDVVQVVDLRRRLGLGECVPTRRTRFIVLHGESERSTGLLVDAVREVLKASDDEVQPSTVMGAVAVNELCCKSGEFISILDLGRILDVDADCN